MDFRFKLNKNKTKEDAQVQEGKPQKVSKTWSMFLLMKGRRQVHVEVNIEGFIIYNY